MFQIGDKVRLRKEMTPDVLESLAWSQMDRFSELSIDTVYEVDQNRTRYQDRLIGLVGVTYIHPEIFFEKVSEPEVTVINEQLTKYVHNHFNCLSHCGLLEWQENCDVFSLIYWSSSQYDEFMVTGKTKGECINKLIHKLSEEWLERNAEEEGQ